jgi:NDP-sugar pyrophosphorylase family protein
MELSPAQFFDLTRYAHRDLFAQKKYVWEALQHLKGYLDSLLTQRKKFSAIEGVVLENSELIFLGERVRIEKGAYIQGPCYIGDGTVIRSGAYVREYVLTGQECVIGHGTEVKRSILLNRAIAAHFNYIGDSILGNGINLGAGAKCANLRFDHKPIRIRVENQVIDTGMKKLGVILGDGAQMGCNAVSNPGTLFFPNATCLPCMNVKGVVISSVKN